MELSAEFSCPAPLAISLPRFHYRRGDRRPAGDRDWIDRHCIPVWRCRSDRTGHTAESTSREAGAKHGGSGDREFRRAGRIRERRGSAVRHQWTTTQATSRRSPGGGVLAGRSRKESAKRYRRNYARSVDQPTDLCHRGELVRCGLGCCFLRGARAGCTVVRVQRVGKETRNSRGRLNTTLSCWPERLTGASPPHSRIRITTLSTRTSGADAPAVTPTAFLP
jgi:hypothetical protein